MGSSLCIGTPTGAGGGDITTERVTGPLAGEAPRLLGIHICSPAMWHAESQKAPLQQASGLGIIVRRIVIPSDAMLAAPSQTVPCLLGPLHGGCRPDRRCAVVGFTLVELLVVIGIIAVLLECPAAVTRVARRPTRRHASATCDRSGWPPRSTSATPSGSTGLAGQRHAMDGPAQGVHDQEVRRACLPQRRQAGSCTGTRTSSSASGSTRSASATRRTVSGMASKARPCDGPARRFCSPTARRANLLRRRQHLHRSGGGCGLPPSEQELQRGVL